MDSLHVPGGFEEGMKAYDTDVAQLRVYTDIKDSCLYSFYMDSSFLQPNIEVPCDFYDTFRGLVQARIEAFEAMY